MAVVDLYAQADKEAGNGKKFPAVKGSGSRTIVVSNLVSVAAADDNGSVYRVFCDIPSSVVPINITIQNEAITGGTDYDLGLYATNSGAVVEVDILADGLDMSSARTIATANNAGMTSVPITGGLKSLATLSGQTNPSSSYDIALTANTVGTGAGVILVTMTFTYL